MARGQSGPVIALSSILMAFLILVSCMQGCCIQPSYAVQQQEEGGVRTLAVKAYIGKSAVEQRTTQTISFQVADAKTHQPIGGAITSTTIKYADGQTIRQFSAPTDASGRSTISWRIERNAPAGHYDVVYSVSETGYIPESNFGNSFSVIARGISLTNDYDGIPSSYTESSSYAQGPAGSAIHTEPSIHMGGYYN